MQTILRLVGNADAFFARSTAGFVAVAIMLTIAVVAQWAVRQPDIFQVLLQVECDAAQAEFDADAGALGIEPVDPRAPVRSAY